MPKDILIVDDDPHIRDVVVFALEKAGMQVRQSADGKQALDAFRYAEPSLMILDIGLPEMDGLEVCKAVRKSSDVPILFLSARDDEIDRVVGLEIGGDDYVTKPFSPRELVARVNAILKRSSPTSMPLDERLLQHGLLTMQPHKHELLWDDHPLTLTATEFALIQGMLRQSEHVYDRNALMDMAYDHNIHVSDRTIDSHIRHIRSKAQDLGCTTLIETVHGVGYKLGTCI